MKKYRPSNGTEGMSFVEHYCANCIHEKFMHTNNHADKKCDILSRSFLFKVDEPEYPTEWTFDAENNPTCTNHAKWDWGNDRDGLNEPPAQPPYDPNQLVMFTFDEKVDELIGEPELVRQYPR